MADLSYRFLSNTPIGEDLFAGKSQENIAVILSDVLQRNDFQIIGIDGGWGTGKSNLVKIVEKKLDKSHNFFIYDVWGHQEDDQRKAILVELTEYIADKNKKLVVEHKKWNEKLNKLLSKEKRVTTTTIPFLSIGFILSLFLIIYIPTVTAFAKDMEKERWMLKLFIVLLPILIWLVLYCYKFGINFWESQNRWSWDNATSSLSLSLQQMMQIYGSKQTDETKVETIAEKEPSVKDFRDWMKAIDSDLGTNAKKLVIVLDNFDRLSKKHIQSIWSSIHIFFAEEKYENIKVIIPFDRSHIKNAFSELNGGEKDKDKSPVNFANDYINKTFDLVYRVSPPIMSNWKGFFSKCWTDAVQGHFDETEYIKVEQVFESYARMITPREIIAFINEVISVKLLHSKIPERYIGLFVMNKDLILIDPLKAIIEGDFLNGLSYLYKDDENFQRYITALSYQIDPDNALEIIYSKQLKDSLLNKNMDRLNEIARTEVFSKILSGVVGEFDNYEMPVVALDGLTDEANISENQLQYIWDTIFMIEKGKKISEFIIKDHHKVLFRRISPMYKPEWAKGQFVALQEDSNFDAVKYAEIVEDYNTIDKENNFGVNIFKLLPEKVTTVENFISLVNAKKSGYKPYKISTIGFNLNNSLSKRDSENIEDLNVVQYLIDDYDFEKLKKSIIQRIQENTSDFTYLSKLYPILKYLVKSRELIQMHLSDSELNTLYSQSESEDDFGFDLIAIRLARGDSFRVAHQNHLDAELERSTTQLVNKVAERIEYYIHYGDLLKMSTSFINPLMLGVVQNIVENEYQTKTADIKELITLFDQISDVNSLSPEVFITNLDGWDTPEFESSFFKSIPESFWKETLKSETQLAKKSLSALKKYFDELSEDEWVEVFTNTEDKDFGLIKLTNYNDWNSFALSAIERVILNACKNGVVNNENGLNSILQSFESIGKDLTDVFKNVRDEFLSGRAKMNTDVFSFLGERLFQYGVLEEKGADVFRTILIASLLSEEACLLILNKHSVRIKDLLKAKKDQGAVSFREAIIDRFKIPMVEELAHHLGIKKPKEETEEQ